jgi:hypothetical protein
VARSPHDRPGRAARWGEAETAPRPPDAGDAPRLTDSSPILANSDGNGFDDGVEVAAGTDPNDPFSFPASVPLFGRRGGSPG